MADEESDTDENMTEHDDNDSDYEEEKPVKSKRIKRSNGKWKLYYENKQFKKEWLELFPWVEEDHNDPKFAKCTACNKKIKAHKGILETHQKTKRHLKNLSGSDDIEDDEEQQQQQPKKEVKSEPRMNTAHAMPNMMGEDQFSFFTESPIDAAHQAVTTLIDKLVEKYHENRLENLKVQNDAMLQLNQERANLLREENQRKLELSMQKDEHNKEVLETHMKYLAQQHEIKINAMEDERDAKLKAVEQQLVFARQEYEKKVKLLDQQLQYIK
ncbi:hypothetical protein JTE90_007522 [Oedothorax gibbosus]|uniref:BED-type domain-containing protein n=1 Tax=Oedothorax gibbosus TaxID=931172 RepID=A0AAV6VLA2_9ARAC|nr:hypothetical protein JTE90_007522 [Oedothorax gibbosus]